MRGLHAQLSAPAQHRMLGHHRTAVPDDPRAAFARHLHRLADQHERHGVAVAKLLLDENAAYKTAQTPKTQGSSAIAAGQRERRATNSCNAAQPI